MIDYYSILQVEETASQEEIKHAYHKMVRLFHPDNFNGSKEEVEKQMFKINEAYEILSDKEKREEYDKKRGIKLSEPKSPVHDDSQNDYKYSDVNTEFRDNVPAKSDMTDTSGGCSSCLAKLIEWAIYIGILCFVIDFFNLDDKLDKLIDKTGISKVVDKDSSKGELSQLQPNEIIDNYFEYLREGNDESANNLFSIDASQNFQSCTVQEFNKTIVDLYYGFEKDIPMYPLFKEIRNFDYAITGVEINNNGEKAIVEIKIENCDVALIAGLLLQADSFDHVMENMSDSELQTLFQSTIEQYKETCLISTEATFMLQKDNEGGWKINSITPLKDFSTVIVGQAADLVLMLNGEEVTEEVSDYVTEDAEYPYYAEDSYNSNRSEIPIFDGCWSYSDEGFIYEMYIEDVGDGRFEITIMTTHDYESQERYWEISGSYSEVDGGIIYSDASCYEIYYSEEIQDSVWAEIYADGYGFIYMSEGMLYWDDYIEYAGMECTFVRSE